MAKPLFYFIVFFFWLFVQNGQAQNALEKETEVFANAADAEKIYLQLSGTSFNTSETIWFKAIVTEVIDHIPTTKSGVLHVELIDPLDNSIVEQNLLKISGGVANGFFQLHSSYREGKYIVRAYTDWNKNFGPDFITSVPIHLFQVGPSSNSSEPIRDITFIKDLSSNTFSISSHVAVRVLDSLHTGDAILHMTWKGGADSILINPEKTSNGLIRHRVPLDAPIINYRLQTQNDFYTKSIVLDDEYGSLQFFPEGGSLVEGLQSVVGFKYLDYWGKGTEIQGRIIDEKNNKVAEFKSNALGMGQVILIPEPGKSYYGVLTSKSGKVIKYELPKAKKMGQVLSLIHRGPYKELRIWNKEKNRDSLFIKLFHKGRNLFFLKGRFGNGMFSFRMKPEDLPQGVIGLTVYDQSYSPVAERHFFNDRQEENLSIELDTNRDLYAIRDSVQVFVTTKQNGEFVPASLSVMAVDSSYFYGTHRERNTIMSYFLLQSDVKGTIENPSYYFENDQNLAELDYLMLTQGWTNYKYKERIKPRLFSAEKGLEIKGTVEGIKVVRNEIGPKKNQYELNMLLMGEPIEALTQETDSTGYFTFEVGDSYGLGRKYVIQPANDLVKNDDLKITIKEYEVPEIAYDAEQVIVPVDSIIEKRVVEKIQADLRLDPFLMPNTIALEEVVVSDYIITPERAEMVELHGIPDVVIESNELLERQKNWTKNLYRWLLFNYPSELRVRRVGNGSGFEIAYVHDAGFTYVVIDGYPVHLEDYRLIGTIPVNAVKSVEIIRNTSTANGYHGQVFDCAPLCPPPPFPAILAIYTHSGKGLSGAFPNLKSNNLINDIAPQYSPILEYYVPEYHEPEKIDWSVPDRRALLNWKPDIVTNSNGQAKTTFFNSDLTGKMVIICEGITSDGRVGYAELSYKVYDP